MSRIGVLGGMGPSASVDFLDKLIKLTPASCDQEHLPVILANLPQVHDRSNAILGRGPDPLPQLLAGIDVLNAVGVGVVAIPCNSSHHWFDEMSRHSCAPLLHIATATVDAVCNVRNCRAVLFATRGALISGFYQRELDIRGIDYFVPDIQSEQQHVDDCIREIKAGNLEVGAKHFAHACSNAKLRGATTIIMGCTEIPIASRFSDVSGFALIDSSYELARATVAFALTRKWNTQDWGA